MYKSHVYIAIAASSSDSSGPDAALAMLFLMNSGVMMLRETAFKLMRLRRTEKFSVSSRDDACSPIAASAIGCVCATSIALTGLFLNAKSAQ